MGWVCDVTSYHTGHLIHPVTDLQELKFWVLLLLEDDLNLNTYVTKAALSFHPSDNLEGGIDLHQNTGTNLGKPLELHR